MQRAATDKTRGPNAAEKRYQDWLHTTICAACQSRCAQIAHHCGGATYKVKVEYVTELIGHWFQLGLCQSCDDLVTKSSRKAFRAVCGSQARLWMAQIETYPRKDEVPGRVYMGIMESGL